MEVAAGAIVAEQAISTTIEGAVLGAVALGKSTQPLKARFNRFATTPDEKAVELLHVSRHSLNVIDGQAYIFGGQLADGSNAGSEMHIFTLETKSKALYTYKCVPAVAAEGSSGLPTARYGHTANPLKQNIYLFGGHSNGSLAEANVIWFFNTDSLTWKLLETTQGQTIPCARFNHSSAIHGDSIVIHGGQSDSNTRLNDTWIFHTAQCTWSRLPDLDLLSSGFTASIAVVDDTLYLVDHTAKGEVALHFIDMTSALSTWQMITFAQDTALPAPRQGASLLPIDRGMGRKYLVYMLGKRLETNVGDDIGDSNCEQEFCSDIWAYQLEAQSVTAAGIKDATNENLGNSSDRSTWAEVVIEPVEETSATGGKTHPGPRGYFAATTSGLARVVIWGGVTAKGTTEGDGWFIDIE